MSTTSNKMKTFLNAAIFSAVGLTGLAVTGLTLSSATMPSQSIAAETKSAYFAGGCFWCIEKDFEHVEGVSEVESGYQGGDLQNPTYRNHGQHIEGVRVDYDPAKIDYATLLHIYFRSIDPTDAGGQFCDRGNAYTTAIFANDDMEAKIAKAAIAEAGEALGKPIATKLRGNDKFWKAEGYHQDYYKKNPVRYKYYRFSCGRNQTVKKLWGEQAYTGVNLK